MNFDALINSLVALAAIGTIVQFFFWVYDRRKRITKALTLTNVALVFSVVAGVLLIIGQYGISLVIYIAAWATYIAVFFDGDEETFITLKSKIFNLVLATGIVIFVSLISLISDLVKVMPATIDSMTSILNQQEKILDILESMENESHNKKWQPTADAPAE
jgi:hypothetical protein